MLLTTLILFYQLLVCHALTDFGIQTNSIGLYKNRHHPVPDYLQSVLPPWWIWMTAHTLIQSGMVYFVTGSLTLGLVEFVVHWITDNAKCDDKIGPITDQVIHVACMLIYAIVTVCVLPQ